MGLEIGSGPVAVSLPAIAPIAVPADSRIDDPGPQPTAEPAAPAAATAPLEARPAAEPLSWEGLKAQFGQLRETLLKATGIDPGAASKYGASHPLPGVIEAVRKSNAAFDALQSPPDLTLESLAAPPPPGLEDAHARGIKIVEQVTEAAADCACVAASPEFNKHPSLLRQAGEVLWGTAKLILGFAVVTPIVAAVQAAASICHAMRVEDFFVPSNNLADLAQSIGKNMEELKRSTSTFAPQRCIKPLDDLFEAWKAAAPKLPQEDQIRVGLLFKELPSLIQQIYATGHLYLDPQQDGPAKDLIGKMSELAGEIATVARKTQEASEGLLRSCGRIMLLAIVAPVAAPVNACFYALCSATLSILSRGVRPSRPCRRACARGAPSASWRRWRGR